MKAYVDLRKEWDFVLFCLSHNGVFIRQGSTKPPSGRLGQVDFPVGQVTFHAVLPMGKGPGKPPS